MTHLHHNMYQSFRNIANREYMDYRENFIDWNMLFYAFNNIAAGQKYGMV